MNFPEAVLRADEIAAYDQHQHPSSAAPSWAKREPYASLRVSKGQVRLLDLDAAPDNTRPDSQSDSDTLTATLRVVSLASHPRFAALSYVWGIEKPSPGNTISLITPASQGGDAGHPMRFFIDITPNCRDALLHIRRQFGAVTIWVDAICIDQEDDRTPEKAEQIGQMQELYSWADPVYVWLGRGDERAYQAIDYLSRASVHYQRLEYLEYYLSPWRGPWDRLRAIWRLTLRICIKLLPCYLGKISHVYIYIFS